jgi:signal transduction histidine kinase
MIRLGLGARLAIVVLVSLIVAQLAAVGVFFFQRSRDAETGFRAPLPDQVAALVELLESAPKERRSTILRAANGSNLSVRVTGDPLPERVEPAGFQAQIFALVLKRHLYRAGLQNFVVIVRPLGEVFAEKISPVSFETPGSAEVYVRLKTGETLAAATTGVLNITVFGLPPGFWAGVMGGAVALVAIVLVRREARPLRELARAVDRMNLPEAGDSIPDAPRGAPEIRALIAAFNRLRERVASLIKARMAMVGGVSHDLRTFATRLRLRAELIPDEKERAGAQRDIDDMIRLLDDALAAIRTGAPSQALEMVDMAALMAREAADWRLSGARASFRCGFTEEDGVFVLGDELALRRLVSNVVSNALTYGKEARISAEVREGVVEIIVDDDGPGLPVELRDAVREPFVRVEASRNRKTGGAGLGLAIAQNVADAHGGRLAITDAPGGGARVIVALSVFDPAEA